MAAQPAAAEACACSPAAGTLPTALLDVTLEDATLDPPLLTVTVDYEQGVWRADALARHIIDWVLDFALRHDERAAFNTGTGMEQVRRAVQLTFGNGADRGVPGEILLHAICRQVYGADTVINKMFFKTAANDTVKGFDGVHCVHAPGGLELWLGEAKFYKDLGSAISAAVEELDDHLGHDYLRSEFALIAQKIEGTHPHEVELRKLMHPNTSLDAVFSRVVVPVLLTFDSTATQAHSVAGDEWRSAVVAEARQAWKRFCGRLPEGLPVALRLVLVPLGTKETLLEALECELTRWR